MPSPAAISGANNDPAMTIPIFNLGRRDLPWSLLIFVTFTFIAILLLKGSTPTDDLLKHSVIVICAVAASAFLGISLAKIFWGKGDFCAVEDEVYESIEDSPDSTAPNHQSTLNFAPTQKRPQQASERIETIQYDKGHTYSIAHINTSSSMSTRSHEDLRVQSSQTVQAPRLSPREKEIDCGIEIAKALEDFEYNSIVHPKGSIRITRVHRDGVSEASMLFICVYLFFSHFGFCPQRQGACSVGDVLIRFVRLQLYLVCCTHVVIDMN